MVSGVVGNQQNLSKVGLTLTMRNPGFEIDLWISAQVLQRSPISEKVPDALVPGRGIRR
jgi:hypothetical protein